MRPRFAIAACRPHPDLRIEVPKKIPLCEYADAPTILTSQLPKSHCHAQIGDPTLADGILDRLVHNAHRIEIGDDSYAEESWEAERIAIPLVAKLPG